MQCENTATRIFTCCFLGSKKTFCMGPDTMHLWAKLCSRHAGQNKVIWGHKGWWSKGSQIISYFVVRHGLTKASWNLVSGLPTLTFPHATHASSKALCCVLPFFCVCVCVWKWMCKYRLILEIQFPPMVHWCPQLYKYNHVLDHKHKWKH